jgi:hypothetical protein
MTLPHWFEISHGMVRMTVTQFRKLALSFPEATESAHHGHPDFRVGGKIFATLGYPDKSSGAVMLDPDEQRFFMRLADDAFSPAAGAWGKKGSTIVHLPAAKAALVRDSLEAAWRHRAPKRLLSND